MKKFGYWVAKVKTKINKSQAAMIDFYRKNGVTIGDNCRIASYIGMKEAFLIEIGDNVVISTNVTFVTHDFSSKLIWPDKGELFGRIKIGNNCFIGQNATIMYGVTIADNTIVAAGSVVTKSFPESNIIIGGNPAKVIGTWEKYREKNQANVIKMKDMMRRVQENDDSFLVVK